MSQLASIQTIEDLENYLNEPIKNEVKAASDSAINLLKAFNKKCHRLQSEAPNTLYKRSLELLPSKVIDIAFVMGKESLAPISTLDTRIANLAVQWGEDQIKKLQLAHNVLDPIMVQEKRELFVRMIDICKGQIKTFRQVKSYSFFKNPTLKKYYCKDPERRSDDSKLLTKDEILEFWTELSESADVELDRYRLALIPKK